MDYFDRKADIDPRDRGALVTELPRHLYIPGDAQSIDIRALATVPALSSGNILEFVAPRSGKTTFIGYALFNDALLFNDVEFVPTVDGARILPYHGTPQAGGKYKLSLGVGPDMNNSSLIKCLVSMEPGQKLVWEVRNAAAVDVVMGVRMAGYLDSKGFRSTSRVGG